jgi:mRNA interferase RelE/StbE
VAYRVVIAPAAQREISRLRDASLVERLRAAIVGLANDPRPPGSLKLRGAELWRIRIGDYRVIYEIRDAEVLVRIITVRHRSDAYRR